MTGIFPNTYGYANSLYAVSATAFSPTRDAADVKGSHTIKNPGESTVTSPGRTSSPAECETCRNRKYQDGSDEMVSFKSAAHISPEASASRVRAHEQEHVSNAYRKAAQGGGKVLAANVTLKTAVCPECGRSYVAGGTTATQIQYSNEENPYTRNRKASDAAVLTGSHIDLAV